MADGPSAEDSSSSSSSVAELASGEGGAWVAVGRVPRERHKLSAMPARRGLCDEPQRGRAGSGSSERRGTRQQHSLGEAPEDSGAGASASSLKIASAVVLVERSEIATIESRKKMKLAASAAPKKEPREPREPKKDRPKSAEECQPTEPEVTLLQEGQLKRKKTRAAAAAAELAKKAGKAREDAAGANLVGPCAKKRCADRYDSSESSDSGVAVSCGDCSSSSSSLSSGASGGSLSSGSSTTGSDITEPGSPCSNSSSGDDEGVGGVRSSSSASSASGDAGESQQPQPELGGEDPPSACKLAPTQQQPPAATRPQWPWTPPLAATACSNGYKRFKAEPEHGSLPRQAGPAADPGSRHGKGVGGGQAAPPKQYHQPDSQGKITEYFKSQIKPQPKTKKGQSNDMSVLVAKGSPEFRRPATVQRKNGLSKGLSRTAAADWEVRALGLNGLQPRLNGKHATAENASGKKATTTNGSAATTTTTNGAKVNGLPVLPIPSDVLSTLPSCKISNLRLTSEARPSESPPPTFSTPTAMVIETTSQFKDKQILVNENNNLTSDSAKDSELLSRLSLPSTPSGSTKDDEEEEEESSRDSAESKRSSLASPILSAPTTIRFPVKAPGKDRQSQTADSGVCRWDKCNMPYDTSSVLLEHLQLAHISTQTGGDNFVCHWQGCKVQGRSSCSRRWLERHVLSHGGNKPFQCIVDGCGSRFSSQTALERHVNGHFNQSENSNSSTSRKSTDSSGKLVRRNGKKLRYRRQPWSARIFDYFDPGVMEGLQHRLLELAQTRTQGLLAETPGDSMALTSQVLAKRVELDGKTKVLLRWHPQDIEPDEWVLESEVRPMKYVSIRSVASKRPEEVKIALYPALNDGRPPMQRVKQRRKPVKDTR